MKTLKCVVVGDSASGKTCMLETYVNGSMPDTFVPTVYNTYSTHASVDSESIELALTDTGGAEGYDSLRPVAYPQTDVFIVCIDLSNSAELVLGNVRIKWYPELIHHCPNAQIILVGTKLDLRTNSQTNTNADGEEKGETLLTAKQANAFAKEIKAVKYLECSATTKQGLKEVFEEAARFGLNSSGARKAKKKGSKHHGDSKKVSSFFNSLSSSRRSSETSSKPDVPAVGETKDSSAATSPEEPSVKSPSSIKSFFRGLRPGKTYSYNVATQEKSLDKKTEAQAESCEPTNTSGAEESKEPIVSPQEAEEPELSDDEQPSTSTGGDENSDAEPDIVEPDIDLEDSTENSDSPVDNPEPVVLFRTTDSKAKDNTLTLKVVLVGDEAVGKTSLLTAFADGQCSQEYVPTEADDCFAVEGSIADSQLCLRLWDVSCAEFFDKFRPLRYRQADVFLVCFSLISSASFENVRAKWYPEVSHHCPEKPVILVGTKLDLRDDPETIKKLNEKKLAPISELEGKQMAEEIGAEAYIECSALGRNSVEDTFREAVLASVRKRTSIEQESPVQSRSSGAE